MTEEKRQGMQFPVKLNEFTENNIAILVEMVKLTHAAINIQRESLYFLSL